MEEKKSKEAEFHNKLRALKEDSPDHKYLTSNKKFYSVVRSSRVFIKEWLIQRCRNKRVLDYCCGDGGTSIFLAKNSTEAVGIDISPVSIENCKKNAIREGVDKNTDFLVMDAEKLEFEDDYFDAIVCSGVLHHLDIQKAYTELVRVLKPEGKIICGEPLMYNPLIQLYRKMTPHLRTEWEMQIMSYNFCTFV